jgi:putative ATP-dependent endonuclease of OLD family
MHNLKNLGIRVRHFKCFEDWQGIDAIYPINLIVGRNNAGKSTVLDLVSIAVRGGLDAPRLARGGHTPQSWHESRITADQIEETFDGSLQITTLGSQTREFALRNCIGLRAISIITPGQAQEELVLNGDKRVEDPVMLAVVKSVLNRQGWPLSQLVVARLRADRDVRPEKPTACDHVGEDGEHATRLVERYLNETAHHELVENVIVSDLNTILQPDWRFSRIFPKRRLDGQWELELEDSHRKVVPLSHTGSGLKTLLLVLVNLHLVPHAKSKPLSRFVFCFEELENNLHPAVQRRLFRFLLDKAVKEHCHFFVTTHSNAVIDLFAKEDEAQILHVVHDGEEAKVRPVSTYLHQCRVLDDLDVRASDLLQANVLVWVEGPSDRLYFNRWIELWSGGMLKEQVHYQCVWYGGSLLADVTFGPGDMAPRDPAASDPCEGLLTALRVNRHAVVLMDSDRRDAGDPLKPRVERVCQELREIDGVAWVTAGREVENYIPVQALQEAIGTPELSAAGQYADVFEHLGGRKQRKVDLAHLVVPYLTKEMLQATYDLPEMLDRVCKQIRAWNGMLDGA